MDGDGTKWRVILKRGKGDISDGSYDVGMGKYNSFLQSYNRLIGQAICKISQRITLWFLINEVHMIFKKRCLN